LILAAEYDRIRRINKQHLPAVNLHLWNKNVYAALYQIGFFTLLGFSGDTLRDDVIFPPISTDLYIAPMQLGDNADISTAACLARYWTPSRTLNLTRIRVKIQIHLFHRCGG